MKNVFYAVSVVALFGCSEFMDSNKNHVPPKVYAERWIAEYGLRVQGLSCAETDSDQDGYVSCDLNLGEGKMEQIQCAAEGAFAMDQNGCNAHPVKGCKRVKPNVAIQQ